MAPCPPKYAPGEDQIGLSRFSDIFQLNMREDQKKVLPPKRGASGQGYGTVAYGKSGP